MTTIIEVVESRSLNIFRVSLPSGDVNKEAILCPDKIKTNGL